jgi:hypothetical protein
LAELDIDEEEGRGRERGDEKINDYIIITI